jgi:hypothetical protein
MLAFTDLRIGHSRPAGRPVLDTLCWFMGIREVSHNENAGCVWKHYSKAPTCLDLERRVASGEIVMFSVLGRWGV